MTDQSIGVLGCGWLGLPLALEFVSMGYQVKGTTTSSAKLNVLTNNGIDPYIIQLCEHDIDGNISGFLENLKILVVNIPPRFRKEKKESYVKKMMHLTHAIRQSGLESIIFISSTSVYGENEGDITENTLPKPKTESAQQLLNVENLFSKLIQNLTIVRFGGLIGPGRHPVYHLSRKDNLQNGNELVNLIHLHDCVQMVRNIVENNYMNEVFNGVYPLHPLKKEYYTKEAEIRKIDKPKYIPSTKKVLQKRVKSTNFLNKGHVFLTSICS